ncbi:LysR substrate-binding domain-containing protein [Algihabitans albus]|uniref:LysR substrate-binding domain-containing protein n=1 Tax=Algihabitans albus TaxID=2164067 RepID=UPI000E5D5727|nr:LysR substrate-binding domain-containing protein [Algihabitans albus]
MTRSLISLQRISVRQLRLLVAVAETGSMVRAAEVIGLTQPAVTKSIRDLEEDLRVELFVRGRRGVEPTIYGRTLVQHARLVLAQLAHAAEALEDLSHGTGGRVVVGTLLAASAWLLPRAIARLRRERPKVVIEVVEGTNERLQPMLLHGDLDMVIGRLSEVRHRSGVRQEQIYAEEIVILARPDHPLLACETTTLADLQRAEWILPPPETTLRRQLEKAFFDVGLEPPVAVVQSLSLPTNRRLLRESDLLGAWPEGIAADELESGRLVALPIRLSQTLGPVGVSILKGSQLSPAAELFLQTLRDVGHTLQP